MTLSQRLRRVTSGGSYLAEVDGLRFLAILAVVIHHVNSHFAQKYSFPLKDNPQDHYLHNLIENLAQGVHLFFAISGFILALPFAKHFLLGAPKVNLRQYFVRRITRLEPPYLIALTAFFVLYLLINRQESFTGMLPHYLASVFYLHGIIYQDYNLILPVAWTLEVEVQFYILAPLIANVFRLGTATRRTLLIALIAVLPVLQFFFIPFRFSLATQIEYFLVGVLLADFYLTKRDFTLSKYLNVATGLVALLLLGTLNNAGTPLEGVVYPFVVFYFFHLVLNDPTWKRIFSFSWLSIIGGMCYSIYLLHYKVIAFLGFKLFSVQVSEYYVPNLLFQILIHLPVLLVVSALFYLLIEKPCMHKDWPTVLKAKIRLFLDKSQPHAADLSSPRPGSKRPVRHQ